MCKFAQLYACHELFLNSMTSHQRWKDGLWRLRHTEHIRCHL